MQRRAVVLAWGAATLGYLITGLAIALAISNGRSLRNADLAGAFAQTLVPALAITLVGGLIASRRPHNPIGWLLLIGAMATAIQGLASQYVVHTMVVDRGSLPAVEWIAWLGSTFGGLVYPGVVVLILLLFPDGRLPSRQWRVIVWLDIALTAANDTIGFLDPAPLQSPGAPSVANPLVLAHIKGLEMGPVGYSVYLAGLFLVVAAAASLVVRLRRATGLEREQVRWVTYALGTTVFVSAAYSVASLIVPAIQNNIASDAIVIAGFGIGLPAAIGVAMLRHHLFDIDVVISRTLVYGALAAFITAVYVGIAVGIGTLIGGGGKPNLGLSIFATAVVAVGFQPVREAMQKVANRLVYGQRATPYEVLSQFSQRVAESYATDDVMPRMARVLAEGTGAQRAEVWLRSGNVWREAAVWPVDAMPAEACVGLDDALPPANGANRQVVVRHQGELLGALSVTKRSGESLTPVEENLLSHLAGQAGLVLKNVGLTSDLQARIEELRASRQRLITAQDQERRRLERNLHDGAQQHLVAIKVKLGLAEMLLGRDPEKTRSTLEQLQSDADDALETLRDLARGIYPPLLAEKGLPVALRAQARKATLPVTVEADGVRRYSQDIEAALYFCTLEALQNIQKYAGASRATVRLGEREGQVLVEVVDDGCGFDVSATARGDGLTNMEDRLDALGGRLEISSIPGRGTTLSATLPLRSPILSSMR